MQTNNFTIFENNQAFMKKEIEIKNVVNASIGLVLEQFPDIIV